MELREIVYGSSEYKKSLELRNKVMRIPLGLCIYDEDFSSERENYILGAFDADMLLGVGVLDLAPDHCMVKYLCVDTSLQGSGIGAGILSKLEEIAIQSGICQISMDARVSAQGFYEKQGYCATGEIYLMDCAPIEHICMYKKL